MESNEDYARRMQRRRTKPAPCLSCAQDTWPLESHTCVGIPAAVDAGVNYPPYSCGQGPLCSNCKQCAACVKETVERRRRMDANRKRLTEEEERRKLLPQFAREALTKELPVSKLFNQAMQGQHSQILAQLLYDLVIREELHLVQTDLRTSDSFVDRSVTLVLTGDLRSFEAQFRRIVEGEARALGADLRQRSKWGG